MYVHAELNGMTMNDGDDDDGGGNDDEWLWWSMEHKTGLS
jgi:hypothetical protein